MQELGGGSITPPMPMAPIEEGETTISEDQMGDLMKQIARIEKSFLMRFTELEKYGTQIVKIEDNIGEL